LPVSLRTPFCRELGIDLPIFSAGMGSVAGPDLAAAVSEAGGFGVVGLAGASPEVVRERVRATRERTKRPFGGNVIIDEDGLGGTPEWHDLLRDEVRAAVGEGVAAIILFWGDPAPYVAIARAASDAKVLLQIGSVAEAEAAVAAGVDAVIAQGIEAGGHVRGTTSIWELLPAVVDAVSPVPVLASGGIGDGAGVARALALGAQAVSLGTRFVASEEAWAHPEYKRRLVSARAVDTAHTEDLYGIGWSGAPHRALRNHTFAEWEAAGRPPLGARSGEGTSIGTLQLPGGARYEWQRYAGDDSAFPTFEGELDDAPLWAGESVEVVDDVAPAGELVRRLAEEAAAEVARTGQREAGIVRE
jgi:NAD(P)H-dependent flavin oxidoreductase YrpB (nitropropane dioxygenase family)